MAPWRHAAQDVGACTTTATTTATPATTPPAPPGAGPPAPGDPHLGVQRSGDVYADYGAAGPDGEGEQPGDRPGRRRSDVSLDGSVGHAQPSGCGELPVDGAESARERRADSDGIRRSRRYGYIELHGQRRAARGDRLRRRALRVRSVQAVAGGSEDSRRRSREASGRPEHQRDDRRAYR